MISREKIVKAYSFMILNIFYEPVMKMYFADQQN